MPSGKALIAESSTVSALMARHWSHRKPLSVGVVSVLTMMFWAVWVYLVLPLVSLVLWALGLRLFVTEIARSAYEGLRSSLISYSTVLLVLVGLLAIWIAWNVNRYGGSRDRRTVKRPEATDPEIQRAFRLDDSLLAELRGGRFLRIDLDGDDCVVVHAGQPLRLQTAVATAGRSIGPQRDRDSTRSG